MLRDFGYCFHFASWRKIGEGEKQTHSKGISLTDESLSSLVMPFYALILCALGPEVS